MRDRLIELIGSKICDGYSPNCDEYSPHTCKNCYANDCKIGDLADAIIADGWVKPPCNIGDTVYRIVKMSTGVTNKHKVLYKDGKITGIITPCEPTIKCFIRCVEVTKNNLIDVCENFGKTVFSTREEAERAMKEGAE